MKVTYKQLKDVLDYVVMLGERNEEFDSDIERVDFLLNYLGENSDRWVVMEDSVDTQVADTLAWIKKKKKKSIIMMVGLPRSGKSTWTSNYVKAHPETVIVSADEIRKLVYGHDFWADGEDLAWAIRGIILKMLMLQGKHIIIDETNTGRERRASIVRLAKKHGYTVTAVHMSTPPSICKERAEKNKNLDLVPIINRMASNFEPLLEKEGYASIVESPLQCDLCMRCFSEKTPYCVRREEHERRNQSR